MVSPAREDSKLKPIPIVGVVPYSLLPKGQSGELICVPPQISLGWLRGNDFRGKIVLRDFPLRKVPYALAYLPAYYKTPDLASDLGSIYERPGLAEQSIYEDFIEAGKLDATGVIFAFEIARDQVGSYWEPYKATHYETEAVTEHQSKGRKKNRTEDRRLEYTDRGELMIWCTGPSAPVVQAVREAIVRRKLDCVLSTRGVSFPNVRGVPKFTSFGGIGTYYHNLLLPTTSLISGPWSLWAPSFGIEAVDVHRLWQQTLAIGDVYFAIDSLPKESIVGGYSSTVEKANSNVATETTSEQASDSTVHVKGAAPY
ncbi:hypothetical protein SEUCBS139899_000937 [Sporothrix eucalyptigena]